MQALGVQTRDFRVLVAGYININVIDGSAFFLAGVSSMLAGSPFVQVGLLTANPIVTTEVVDEVLYLENIEVIDPYSQTQRSRFCVPPEGSSMTRSHYADLIADISDDYDAIILRDTETASLLIEKEPELASKLHAYVTGITSASVALPDSLVRQLNALNEAGTSFLCQTEIIKNRIFDTIPAVNEEKVFVLPPHVPDAEGPFEEIYHGSKRPNRFIYTGKFFKDWNTDKILAGFKSTVSQGNDIELEIAGRQFRKSEEDPHFIANNRWLLDSTPRLNWHGGVPRIVSRSLIKGAHIGIGWRSERLNTSSELSTKILEYGALGRPSILNRTELHEELLGNDYPLFANSMSEYKHLLATLPEQPELVEEAAKRCYDVALKHTYSFVRPKLLGYLGNRFSDSNQQVVLNVPFSREDVSLDALDDNEIGMKVEVWGGSARIVPDENQTVPIGVVISNFVNQLELYSRTSDFLRKRSIDLESRREKINTVAASNRRITTRPKVSEPVSKSDKPVSAIGKVKQLESDLEAVHRKLDYTSSRYEALRSSRLGSIQLAFWRHRSGKDLPGDERLKWIFRSLDGLTRWKK